MVTICKRYTEPGPRITSPANAGKGHGRGNRNRPTHSPPPAPVTGSVTVHS